MPKLSQAKRHRKQLNLAACFYHDPLLQTPRKVSEEDLIPQPSLKRPSPSGCLAGLVSCHSSLDLQEESHASATPCPYQALDEDSSQGLTSSVPDRCGDNTCISPIWGHFVDVVTDQEREEGTKRSRTPTFKQTEDEPHSIYSKTGEEHAHHPYCLAMKKKQRKERKQIVSSSNPQSLTGFVLEDPSLLQEALSRLQVGE